MSATPIPIREGVDPQFDGEREMIDYCYQQVRNFAHKTGFAPSRVAMVLMGSKDDVFNSHTASWDSEGKHPRIVTCSTAATLLLQRATAKDD